MSTRWTFSLTLGLVAVGEMASAQSGHSHPGGIGAMQARYAPSGGIGAMQARYAPSGGITRIPLPGSGHAGPLCPPRGADIGPGDDVARRNPGEAHTSPVESILLPAPEVASAADPGAPAARMTTSCRLSGSSPPPATTIPAITIPALSPSGSAPRWSRWPRPTRVSASRDRSRLAIWSSDGRAPPRSRRGGATRSGRITSSRSATASSARAIPTRRRSATSRRSSADPNAAAPRVGLAQLALARGDYAEAAQHFREAQTAEPGWLLHAPDIRRSTSSPPTSPRQIAKLESHLQAHPNDRDAWLVLGAQWYLSGRTRQAADVFLRLTDRKPDATLERLPGRHQLRSTGN